MAESFNRLSRAHERYRQTTDDGRAIAYSERELTFTFEFTFAKMIAKQTYTSSTMSSQYGELLPTNG